MKNNSFRNDINGLRAIAVIAVVLFHFNASWVPGGFAGVDVFFVISGFLMTGIIFRGIEQENFSILKFYVARANRIIPALAVLCLVLLIFGWFYLTPLDYKALGKHAASSMAFLSNIIYWREAGYFDAASHEKWLLHTWSLSVEWQFYIIYPLILVAMRKFMSIDKIKLFILLGTVLGFIFCVIATYKWPNPSYYLLPTRAWEMMIGGVAYLYPLTLQENRKKIVEWIGVILIIGSYFLISAENLWPGYLALFPVLGSFLIIQANRNNSIITNNIIFQKLGAWSYSIYLWHWPLVVIIYTFSLPDHYIYLGVILSIFFGFLSYKYIEKIKFRNDFSSLFSYFKSKPIYMVFMLGGLSSIIFINEGLNRNTTYLEGYVEKTKSTKYCHVDSVALSNIGPAKKLDCRLGSKNSQPIGLLWGDSYAGHLDPFVINFLNEKQSFVSRTASHCVPSISLTKSLGSLPEYCKKIRQKTLQEIKNKKYKVIFLGGRWEYMYTEDGDIGFNAVLDAMDIAAKNAEIVYVVEQPTFYQKNVRNTYLRSKISSYYPSEFVKNDELPIQMNLKLAKVIKDRNYKNVHIINRDVLYGDPLHSDLTSVGIPYTSDTGHLSNTGSIEMSNNFMKSTLSDPLKTKFPDILKKPF
ncbi:acyltransferase family protein [Acinetobacter terrae]|uniref:Acyltransferase n=1 Tax=Acinetobacter terrae TaxID=2731247 RepID=A0ABX1V307_9GAMM|nr:acyltransferase family protein [Acinetobacter terrae]NNH87946.1 acyltransferase [Acinetobacter terrae]